MILVSTEILNDASFMAGDKFQCTVTLVNNTKRPVQPFSSPLTPYSPSSVDLSRGASLVDTMNPSLKGSQILSSQFRSSGSLSRKRTETVIVQQVNRKYISDKQPSIAKLSETERLSISSIDSRSVSGLNILNSDISRNSMSSVDGLTAEIMDTFGIQDKNELRNEVLPFEHLYYATVQIIGTFHLDSSAVKTGILEKSPKVFSPNLSQSEKGDWKEFPAFVSASSLVFSDLKLFAGSSEHFNISFPLPELIPPTYKGKAFKVSYKFVISIQKGSPLSKPRIISIPIKITSKKDTFKFSITQPIVQKTDTFTINNSEFSKEKQSSLEYINMINRRNLIVIIVNFDISKDTVHVAQIQMHRSAFRIGESVIGTIDFSNAILGCYYFAAYLQQVESIDPFFSKTSTKSTVKIINQKAYSALNVQKTGFSLYLPTDLSPEFETDAVNVKWYLKLEFIVSEKQPSVLGAPFNMKSLNQVESLHKLQEPLHFAHFAGLEQSKVQVFDCLIPIQVVGFLRRGAQPVVKEKIIE